MSATHDWDDELWDDQPETVSNQYPEQENELPGDAAAEEEGSKLRLGDVVRAFFAPAVYLRDYARSRSREVKAFYLNHAVPKDEDHPLREGSVAAALMATPWRKLACLVVAVAIGAVFWMVAPL